MSNREILFRGKRLDNGEWVYGYYCNLNNQTHYIMEPAFLTEVWTFTWIVIIPETVGQFTGQTDMKGNKIFHGDIIRLADKYHFEVKFEDAKFVCYHVKKEWGKWGDLRRLSDFDFQELPHEVVGNAIDNKELLNI